MEQWWGDEGEQKWERRTKKRGEEREPDYWLHRFDQVLLAGNFQFNGKRSSEERRPSQWRPSKWPREKIANIGKFNLRVIIIRRMFFFF